MFKAPFSFEGRIRRKEYAFTVLIIFVVALVFAIIIPDQTKYSISLLFFVLGLVSWWIIFAQTTKRCHDVDRSGWYQLIPFYVIYLLFAEGDKFPNQFGVSPKYNDDNDGN
ncbi:MAG: DUF805 domain-containing protein [Sphingobacteriales bacterium]